MSFKTKMLTDLRSALLHTVRAKCRAALLFPPDCEAQSKSLMQLGNPGQNPNVHLLDLDKETFWTLVMHAVMCSLSSCLV